MGKFNGMLDQAWHQMKTHMLLLPGLTGLALLAQGCSEPTGTADTRHPAPSTTVDVSSPASAAVPSTPAAQANDILPPAISEPPAPFEGEGWREMFDGATLSGWRVTDFAGKGEVECRAGVILLNMGNPARAERGR